MDIAMSQVSPGDARLVDEIVNELKSNGIFDKFRKTCLADVDTKPALQNLRQRANGHIKKLLGTKPWKTDMNKNQLRDSVRKDIQESGILDVGIDAIITQVVTPKITPLILPYVEDTVCSFLQIEKPNRELSDECRHVENQVNDFIQPRKPYGLPPHLQKNVYADPVDVLPPTNKTLPVKIQKAEKKLKLNCEVIPVIFSSEADETLLYTNENEATSISDSTQQHENASDVIMQIENAVDSFDSARKAGEMVTTAVGKLSLKGLESCSSVSQSNGVDKKVSNSTFDQLSLNSIVSNQSFSHQLKVCSGKTDTEESKKHMPVDDLRSSQSTPLEDEKIVSSQARAEHGEWNGSAVPLAERIKNTSFGKNKSKANPSKVVSGVSPVSAESQNRLDTFTSKDASEGVLNVDSPYVACLQKLGLDEVSSSESDSPSRHYTPREPDTNSERGRSSKSTSTDGKSRKSNHHDSKHGESKHHRDRHHYSKSKDDSHRKKDTHRRYRDDDGDKHRNSKGHHHHHHHTGSSHHSSSHNRKEKDSRHSSSHRSDKHGHRYKSDHHRGHSHSEKPKKLAPVNEDITLMGKLNKNTVTKHKLSPEPNNNSKLNTKQGNNVHGGEYKNGKKLKENKDEESTTKSKINAIKEESNSGKIHIKSDEINGRKQEPKRKNKLTTLRSSHHGQKKGLNTHESDENSLQKPKKLLALNEDITLMGNLNRKQTIAKRRISPKPKNNSKLNMELDSEVERSEHENYKKLKENKERTTNSEPNTIEKEINSGNIKHKSEKTNNKKQELKVIKNGRTTTTLNKSLRVSLEDISTYLQTPCGKRRKIEKSAILPATNIQRLVICSFNAERKVVDDSDDGSDFEGFEPMQKRIKLDSADMFSESNSTLFDFEGFPDSSFRNSSNRIRNYLARINHTGHCSR